LGRTGKIVIGYIQKDRMKRDLEKIENIVGDQFKANFQKNLFGKKSYQSAFSGDQNLESGT